MGVLLINSGDPAWTIQAGGTNITNVYGTTGVDTVNIESGAKVVLDGSFNAGTDKIYIEGDSTSYKVSNSGATVTLTDAAGNTIVVPAGAVGQTLVFGDGAAPLKIVSGAVTLGTQTVTTTATTVDATKAITDTTTTSDSQFTPVTVTPEFSVAGAASVTEGGTATFTVTLSAAQPSATTVNYALTATGTGAVLGTDTGTATPGNSGTLTFAAGTTTQTITVPVTFDTTPETGEGLLLTLSNAGTGTKLGTAATAATAIADPATPTFTITSDAVAGTPTQEGKNITFTVTPTGIVDKETTLLVNLVGAEVGAITAKAGAADFTSAQTVKFLAGDTAARTTYITVVDDSSTEGIEGYKAQLLNSASAEVASTTGLITDPSTTFVLTGPASVDEGSSATYKVTADRVAPAGGITIPYTITGNATAGTDFTPAATTGNILIAAGATEGTLILNATADVTTEDPTVENVIVTLGTPSTGNVTTGTVTTVINDKSQGLKATEIALSTTATAVDEGGAYDYVVTVGTAPATALNIPYTITTTGTGQATTGTDYTYAGGTATTGNITIAAGATTGKLTITTVADNTTEGTETVKMTITAPATYSLVTGKDTTTTTINDTSLTVTGTTYSLTTGTDNVPGTAGNDTIIGEWATTGPTINAADQISGGSAGVDTFKAYGFGSGGTDVLPASTSAIDILDIVAPANAAINITTMGAPSSVTTLMVEQAQLLNGKTITTTGHTGLTLDLTTKDNAATAGTLTWAANATDTTQNLKLSGFQGGSTVVAAQDLTITGAATTTVNLTSQTLANAVDILTLPATTTTANIIADTALTFSDATSGTPMGAAGIIGAAVTNLKITGAGKVTAIGASTNDLASTVTIDASGNSGGVAFNASKASSLTYKGSSGSDFLMFSATNLTTLDTLSDAGGLDTLVVNDTDLTAAAGTGTVYSCINAASGFDVLGFNTTGASLDFANLTTINNAWLGWAAGTNTFTATNALSSSSFTIDMTAGNAGTVSIGNKVGNSNTTVTLDTSFATAAKTLGTLTLNGATVVALKSTDSHTATTGASNVITTLNNADNSAITVTGDQKLTITNPLAGTSVGTKVDAGTFTAVLDVMGTGLVDELIGGSKADVLIGRDGNDVLTGNAGNDTLIVSSATQADSLTGGDGADTFMFSGGDATLFTTSTGTVGITKITDFVCGTDKIALVSHDTPFTGITLATQTIATAATLAEVWAAITAIAVSVDDGGLQGTVVTVSAGAAAGKYLYVNDTAGAAVSNSADMLINITGITGTLAATDFTFTSTRLIGSTDAGDTIVGTASAETIFGDAGTDVIYPDNAGTKEVQTVTITYSASENDVLTVNGVDVTFATGANLAASTTNLVNAVTAEAALTNIVTATGDTGTGVVTLTWLVDSNAAASADKTSASNTNTVATITAGTTGTTANNVLIGGAGADTFVFNTTSAAPSATVFNTIVDFTTASDIVDFVPLAMTIMQNGAAAAGSAAISAAGVATFHADDDTLTERITAVEGGINTGGAAAVGQVAMFQHGADTYVFISNGTDGVAAGDQLIRLVGVDTTNAAYDTITLASGNFTLA